MTGVLHHRLTRSSLVRLLQQWMPAEGDPTRADVAEHLSQWLSAVDAVRLNGALRSIESIPALAGSPGPGVNLEALEEVCQGLQADLIGLAVAKSAPARVARGRSGAAAVEVIDAQADADFATHGHRYGGLQKQGETRLGAVRAQMRQGLARGTPDLRQLAALDAVLEQMLAAREQKLWAQLINCLEGRWVHWRAVHARQLEASGLEDAPQRWRQPGGWLHAFEQDFRALWQAEVQVRLQPIRGLLEAARNENR